MTKEIEYDGDRVETGPIRIGNDWTGVFIRGDDALPMAMYLRHLLDNYDPKLNMEDAHALSMLYSHLELLESCVEGTNYYENTV